MAKSKIKIPKIAILRKAIKDMEENSLFYRKSPNFNGITIKNVKVDTNTVDEYKVFYDAKVHWFDHTEEYYDCYILLSDIMKFLKLTF